MGDIAHAKKGIIGSVTVQIHGEKKSQEFKEYQGRNYDAQVAAISIVFLRYIVLTVESRNAQDDRTIGKLFFYFSDEMEI